MTAVASVDMELLGPTHLNEANRQPLRQRLTYSNADLSDIGNIVRELRNAHGLTMRALAERCGIASSHISNIENSRISPTTETVTKIFNALNAKVTIQAEWTQNSE